MYKLTNRLAFVAILFLFVTAGSSEESNSSEESLSNANETELEKAPDFEVTTIEGDTVSLEQSIEEDKLVVYFTASWCPIFAKDLLMKYLRKILPYMERITGGLLILAGIYVIHYQMVLV